jgi:outer membrane protein assembly factor BamB
MTVANPPVQSASPYKGVLARHPLISFFVMAYAFSWIAWSPWVLSDEGAGLLPFSSPLLAAALPISVFLGPTVSAFIMTSTTEGTAGIRRLLRRIVLWRVGLRWYLFASSASRWLLCLARSSCREVWHRCSSLVLGTC